MKINKETSSQNENETRNFSRSHVVRGSVYFQFVKDVSTHSHAQRGNEIRTCSKGHRDVVGLRNLLVHEYAEIDENKLYEFLNFLDDSVAFAAEINQKV